MSEIDYVLGRSYLEASKNNTKSRKYFRAQMQSDQTMKTRGYIIPEIKRSKIKPLIAKVESLIAEVWGQEAGRKR